MNSCKCWQAALAAILLLPSLAASADPAAEAYKKGLACFEKEQNDAAVAAFSEAIRLDPKNAEAFCGRGRAYGSKHADKAMADFNEAIRLNPKLAKAYRCRGVVYGSEGEYDKAIAELGEAIRYDPKYADAYDCRVLTSTARANTTRPSPTTTRLSVSTPNGTGICRPGPRLLG